MADLAGLIDRAIAVGSAQGGEATFERLRQFIDSPDAVGDPKDLPATDEHRPVPRIMLLGYGGIKKAIRRIVAKGGGILRQQIADESEAEFGHPFVYSQITEALRSLSRTDEIVRRDKKWFPGPKMDWEAAGMKPDLLNQGSGE